MEDISADIASTEQYVLKAVPELQSHLQAAKARSLMQHCVQKVSLPVRHAASPVTWAEAQSVALQQLQQHAEQELRAAKLSADSELRQAVTDILPQLYARWLQEACAASDVAALQQQLSDAWHQVDQLREEAYASSKADDAIMQQLQHIEAENRRLHATNTKLSQQLSHAESKLQVAATDGKDSAIARLEHMAGAHQARIDELEAECTTLCAEVDALNQQNADLLTKHDELSQQLASAAARSVDSADAKELIHGAAHKVLSPIRTLQSQHAEAMTSPASGKQLPCTGSPSRLPGQVRAVASPTKRAQRHSAAADELQQSPLKKHAQAAGFGGTDDSSAHAHASKPCPVPRSFGQQASCQDVSEADGRSMTAAADLYDVPLSQQPCCSHSRITLRSFDITASRRGAGAGDVRAATACAGTQASVEHQQSACQTIGPGVAEQAVQCNLGALRKAMEVDNLMFHVDGKGKGRLLNPAGRSKVLASNFLRLPPLLTMACMLSCNA